MPNILVADKISTEGIDILRRVANVDVEPDISEDGLVSIISAYDALVVRSRAKVTARIIEAAENLKIIARAGVGVDNIDVSAATQRGIVVVNSPEGNTLAAAELTMALLLALARRIPSADRSMKQGEWNRSAHTGVEVFGKTLGIIGLGRIGTEVARRAGGFGMRVIAQDPFISPEAASKLGVSLVPLDVLIRESDFISLHAPKTKGTESLIGKDEIEKMKSGARIINAARGGLIDEQALADALHSGKVAGAAIDVYSSEPVAEDNPMLKAPNTITTPHLGASTEEAQSKVAADVALQIVDFFEGKPVRSAVNMPAVAQELLKRLSPYMLLAERMGKLISALHRGPVTDVSVGYYGEIAENSTDLLIRSALVGVLSPILSVKANLVNAPIIAEARGIHVTEVRSSESGDYQSLLSLSIGDVKSTVNVSGTVTGGKDVRLVEVQGYRVDIVPEGNMVVVPHDDRPGMVGKVGTILGDEAINIGGMHVGRKAVGSLAIMAISVDQPLPESLIDRLQSIEGIGRVSQVSF